MLAVRCEGSSAAAAASIRGERCVLLGVQLIEEKAASLPAQRVCGAEDLKCGVPLGSRRAVRLDGLGPIARGSWGAL